MEINALGTGTLRERCLWPSSSVVAPWSGFCTCCSGWRNCFGVASPCSRCLALPWTAACSSWAACHWDAAALGPRAAAGRAWEGRSQEHQQASWLLLQITATLGYVLFVPVVVLFSYLFIFILFLCIRWNICYRKGWLEESVSFNFNSCWMSSLPKLQPGTSHSHVHLQRFWISCPAFL